MMDKRVDTKTIFEAKAESALYFSAKITVFAATGIADNIKQTPNTILSIPRSFEMMNVIRGIKSSLTVVM